MLPSHRLAPSNGGVSGHGQEAVHRAGRASACFHASHWFRAGTWIDEEEFRCAGTFRGRHTMLSATFCNDELQRWRSTALESTVSASYGTSALRCQHFLAPAHYGGGTFRRGRVKVLTYFGAGAF